MKIKKTKKRGEGLSGILFENFFFVGFAFSLFCCLVGLLFFLRVCMYFGSGY